MDQAKTIKALTDCGATSAALRTEHRAIEDALQTLGDAMNVGASPETLTQIIDIVVDFCADHFAFEEQTMRDAGWSKIEAHIDEHKRLTARLCAARTAISRGELIATLTVSDLLIRHHDHVKRFDRPAYVHMVQQRIDSGTSDALQAQTELAQLTRSASAGRAG